jgi:hypothetical protein
MRRHAEALQWFGLLGAALVWTAQLVVGYGVAQTACMPAGLRWGLDIDTWEIALMVSAGIFVLLSEAAAVAVFLETRSTPHDGPPPWGRRHFFAAGASLGNVLFLMMVLLSGIGAIYHGGCRQL